MSPHPPLKDLLEQAAETVPAAEVPGDTWQRGRRRHRRSLALRAVAVVGVVALVGLAPGLLDRVTERSLPQPAGGGSSVLGLPDHLHAVPSHLAARGADQRWARDEVSDDLAVGRAAAAWVTPGGLPVLVDAADGDYHLLDLPDFLLASDLATSWFPGDVPPLALSSDGTHLAYAYAWPATDDGSAVPSGLRVVDLETGEVDRGLPLEGGSGVVVTQVSWSPGGTWLAWSGIEPTYWTDSSLTGRSRVSGVIAPDGARRRIVPAGTGTFVDDQGTAAVLDGGRVRVVRPDGSTTTRRGVERIFEIAPDVGALSADGSMLALGTSARHDLVALHLDRDRVTTRSGQTPNLRAWSVRPLGWVGDAVLVQRMPETGDGLLTLVDVDGEVPARDVGEIDGGDADEPDSRVGPLSVATDLVSQERPTVDRPAPEWPWSSTRRALALALAAAGLLGIGGAALAGVRRRRTGAQPRSAR